MPQDASARGRKTVLRKYLVLTYVAILVNASPYLWGVGYAGLLTTSFAVAAFLTQCIIYLAPVFVLAFSLDAILSSRRLGGIGDRLPRLSNAVVYGTAASTASLVQILIYADKTIFRMFGFHVENGFVLNLLMTKGGVESMEAGTRTNVTVALVVIGLIAFQVGLVLLARRGAPAVLWRLFAGKRAVAVTAALAFLVASFQAITFGVSEFRGYTPVVSAAGVFPFYARVTFRRFMKRFGVLPPRSTSLNVTAKVTRLNYPLNAIVRAPGAPNYNIVMLVAESWRWDMLDPEIMPDTWAFAQKAAFFRQHYSGGHDTRSAIFAMFYGLYSPSWFSFKDGRRDPVLMDVVRGAGYRPYVYSSASFTYPEFDQTIWADVPSEYMHSDTQSGLGWERDRSQIGKLLDELDERDKARPFFAFMFFESPHARYFFPEECAIRKPYAEDLNYATMDLQKDIGLIKNRYVNSSRHLDTQFKRVFDYLESRALLDSTIVIATGDHGEEFMEKGHWGHAEGFPQEQIRVPLVMWVPGRAAAEVTRMTSHLDIPATILTALGVTNPPGDYSLGFDLFGDHARESTVVGGWNEIAYVDQDVKIILPVGAYRFSGQKVTTLDDTPIADTRELEASRRAALVGMLREMSQFSR